MYVCNMKIIIKPFKTAAGFENMRVKITIAFVNELKRKKKKKINFWEYLRPPQFRISAFATDALSEKVKTELYKIIILPLVFLSPSWKIP